MTSYLGPVLTREPSPLVLRQVPVPCLREVWPHVGGMIKSVVDRSKGDWTIDGIVDRLLSGDWQLWVIYDGQFRAVIATELFLEMSGRKAARTVFATGLGAKQWVHFQTELESWAQSMGCEKYTSLARKGWARYLTDYKITHVLLEKDL